MTETRTNGREATEEKLPAQYINYAFFKLDPEWRRLPEEERERGKREFLAAVEQHGGNMLLRSFSLMGLRSDADFMLWRISYDLDAFEEMTAALLKSGLGKYLSVAYSYFALSGAPSTSASTPPASRVVPTSSPARPITSSSTRSSRPARGTGSPSKSASA